MLNRLSSTGLPATFATDTFEWFCGRAGHMERWQYLDPAYKGDPTCGSELWKIWETQSGKDNMLHRQGRIIAEKIDEMARLTKPRHTLIDLGPGSTGAIQRNTMPFIDAYQGELKRYISVDISHTVSDDARAFVERHGLDAVAVHDDFFGDDMHLPAVGQSVAVFMGGTIGNIEAPQNVPDSVPLMAERLRILKRNLPVGTVIFIGLEATQDEALLYADYDHAAHKEFEINIMYGIKRDVLPDEDGFDPSGWKYAMKWWPDAYQFCHLAEVTKPQSFRMNGRRFDFAVGDQLVIDNSFKFPVLAMQRAAQMAGCKYIRPFADNDGRMVVHALKF